jgi:DNA/RNA-binding domain of Phe-tRNA-synthetase-like protein
MTIPMHPTVSEAWIDDRVRAARPDYLAVLLAVDGLAPGPTSEHSERLLAAAEAHAQERLAGREPHELPEVAAWRDAFLGFGVKPREARSSVEALLRRTGSGLPRIDSLTDVYNAVSITHLVPIGGEDLAFYDGPARLVVATGVETFDTVADGEPVVQSPSPGEIVWRDDTGVTCRRWNWRQCVRTRLTTSTTTALFIVDGLGPDAGVRAERAVDDLISHLTVDSPQASFTVRLITGTGMTGDGAGS